MILAIVSASLVVNQDHWTETTKLDTLYQAVNTILLGTALEHVYSQCRKCNSVLSMGVNMNVLYHYGEQLSEELFLRITLDIQTYYTMNV